MSGYLDRISSNFLQPSSPDPKIYQKDLKSIEKIVLQFLSAYENKRLSASQLNSYQKNFLQVSILLNSFVKNTFDIMSANDVMSCLKKWQSLVYDQAEKTNYILKNYIEIQSKIQQKNTLIAQKRTTCEKCFLDIRKVNIQEIQNSLQNEYIGTLERIIAEAKMQINSQLFSEQEDRIFFKQLHNILNKKHQNIKLNNNSIESLINKITQEISELNLLKKMSLQQKIELQPPSYTWMENIKVALNELLQSTFKKKLPVFIQNIVKLFEEHILQRNEKLLRDTPTQTDDYESFEINDLKMKILKIDSIKFKLQTDLKWFEEDLAKTKSQMILMQQNYKKQLQDKWLELTEQRDKNKRLKLALDAIIKENQTGTKKQNQTGTKKHKIQTQLNKIKQKSTQMPQQISTQMPQNDIEKQKYLFGTTNQSLFKNTSQTLKKFSHKNFQQSFHKFELNSQFSIISIQANQKGLKQDEKEEAKNQNQKFDLNQQSIKPVSNNPISQISLRQSKSLKNQKDEKLNSQLKTKISYSAIVNNRYKQNNGLNKDRISQNFNQMDSVSRQQHTELIQNQNQQQPYRETEENTGHETYLSVDFATKNLKLKTGQSILLDQDVNEVFSNAPNSVIYHQELNNSQKKLIQVYNRHNSEYSNQENKKQMRQILLNINSNQGSQFKESRGNLQLSKKYIQEVRRINELMEKKIIRSGIMLDLPFSKKKFLSNKQNNSNQPQKQSQKNQDNINPYSTLNYIRKNHARSQTMNSNFKFKFSKYEQLENLKKGPEKIDNQNATDSVPTKQNSNRQNIESFSRKKIVYYNRLNKDFDELMDKINYEIKANRPYNYKEISVKGFLIQFLLKCGLKISENTESDEQFIKPMTPFSRKANKSVTFLKKIKLPNIQTLQVSHLPKKTLNNQVYNLQDKPVPIIYKKSFANSKKKSDNYRMVTAQNQTHNLFKRQVWKSLPDENELQNKVSLQKIKCFNKIQRPMLKQIKNLTHKKHQSRQMKQFENPNPSIRVEIFSKQDFELFIDEANAYSYETAQMKRQPKGQKSIESALQRQLIQKIYLNMQKIKQHNTNLYDQVVSFIRYPYHTIKNLSWGGCMIKGIKYENFIRFMERIIHLHKMCPVIHGYGYCTHLNMFSRKIESIKNQLIRGFK